MQVVPDEIILNMFDADGTLPCVTRKFLFNGVVIDIDEYAATSGLILPDSE